MPSSDVEFLRMAKQALIGSTRFRFQNTKRVHRRQLSNEHNLHQYLAQLAEWVYSDLAGRLADNDTDAAVKLLQAVDALEKSEKEQQPEAMEEPVAA